MAIGVASTFLAVQVHVSPRVGSIHFGGGAVGGAVVGQAEINLAIAGIDGAPLGPVHGGGAHGIGRVACVHKNVRWRCEFKRRMFGNAGVCHAQLQPLTRAIGIEFGDIQTPLTQILVAGDQASAHVLWVPKSGADKFVNVFIARVAAHVKGQGLARDRQAANSGFMSKAAHGRALGGRGIGVERINLHVIAKGVGLMAKVFLGIRTQGCQVPACETVIGVGDGVPTLAAGFFHIGSHWRSGQAVTLARCGFVVGQIRASSGLKIKGPVFFAAQIRAPGGFAMTAVVQGAPTHGA